MTKTFVTGATGLIGGDALTTIVAAHPEYEITALVRDEEKAAKVSRVLPSVKIVIGDLDSAEILEREAAKADVVCNWASADHLPSVQSLLKGLSHHSPPSPGYLVHTSGTGILTIDQTRESIPFGELTPKVYNDWDGLSDVIGLPESAPHRNVERPVLESGEHVRTAIVCPSVVYGAGQGPVNTRSWPIPELVKTTLKQGHGIVVGRGLNHWGAVHVRDLSNLFLLLVEAAASGGGNATWNSSSSPKKEGY
ncbi:hypothetical protein H2199_001414 [Coniosporium tulheliwenetii]|uniref:Uncharacterized protein n=1 Tax=Coniosporium tulheliwenetii TaxID=3383036 RepID=A0ACC2ZLY5_9PEZI|nr:hypothetical protein H2199_001414 [Cladosporium sp. JES 115]